MPKIKIDVDLAKRVLTMDEALDLLDIFTEKRKKRVHSYTSCAIALMGANMDLSQVKKEMKAALKLEDGIENIQIAGRNMNAVEHGVAFWSEKVGWTFLATDKAKLDAIIKKRRITF